MTPQILSLAKSLKTKLGTVQIAPIGIVTKHKRPIRRNPMWKGPK